MKSWTNTVKSPAVLLKEDINPYEKGELSEFWSVKDIGQFAIELANTWKFYGTEFIGLPSTLTWEIASITTQVAYLQGLINIV
jgi:hypothetical protein